MKIIKIGNPEGETGGRLHCPQPTAMASSGGEARGPSGRGLNTFTGTATWDFHLIAQEAEKLERGQWMKPLDFFVSCLGYAVGLGKKINIQSQKPIHRYRTLTLMTLNIHGIKTKLFLMEPLEKPMLFTKVKYDV
jgi:hypothetical protein